MGHRTVSSGFARRSIAWLVLVVAALTAPALASADGGTSIASAPELPLGQQVTGAVSRLDYWRVTIVQGDTLRIDYEPVATNAVELCLMAPSVTDFTVGDTDCADKIDTDYADRKRETVHQFAIPGRYTLVVADNNCISSRVYTKCDRAAGYALTAYVIHRTSTTLVRVGKLARRGSKLTVRGTINGAATGNVVLQERVGKRWVNKKLAKLKGGHFSIRVALGMAGTARFRVLYPGDPSHKPSRAGFQITVV